MKIQEFIKKYNEFKNEELRDKFLKGHIQPNYIPWSEKEKECRRIAQTSTHDIVGRDTKYEKVIFKENTNIRYFLSAMQVIKWYTDLEITEDDTFQEQIKEYELLEEQGLIEIIILLVSEMTSKTFNYNGEKVVVSNEVDRMQRILDASINDIEVNENNMINYFDTKFNAIGLVLNTLQDSVVSALSDVIQENLSLEDIDKLKETFTNIIQFPDNKTDTEVNTNTESAEKNTEEKTKE